MFGDTIIGTYSTKEKMNKLFGLIKNCKNLTI